MTGNCRTHSKLAWFGIPNQLAFWLGFSSKSLCRVPTKPAVSIR